MKKSKKLLKIYNLLYDFFGPQHWWPGDTPFEIMTGAILTQNTNWQNVEKAIKNLKERKALSPDKIIALEDKDLAELLRPSGYFNVKAKRLKSFVNWYKTRFNGNIKSMRKMPLDSLRSELLTVNGVGEETADSILLYAAEKLSFVIDAYTKRIFSRIGICKHDVKYANLRKLFMENIPEDIKLYNEYHALIVALGKDYCKPKPVCEDCPLKNLCGEKIKPITKKKI